MDSEYHLKLPLSKTYSLGNESFSSLAYREPRYPDFVAEGDPQEWIHGDNSRWYATSREVVGAYVNRLFERSDQVQVLCLADVLLIEEIVLGFFAAARRFVNSRATSSGAWDGDQEISET